MDDEDSKARRNFMAVSTIIVLAWWLQAPLDKISEKLLGMSSVGPGFEWRAWFAALVALVYFALRFRFSSGHREAMGELREESAGLRDRLLTQWLEWEVASFQRWRLRGPVIGEALERATAEVAARNSGNLRTVAVSEILPGRTDHEGTRVRNSRGSVLADVTVFVATDTPRVLGMAGTRTHVRANLTSRQRLVLTAWKAAWLLAYSRTSTALLVPWIVGTAAAIVCTWRIWQAVQGA